MSSAMLTDTLPPKTVFSKTVPTNTLRADTLPTRAPATPASPQASAEAPTGTSGPPRPTRRRLLTTGGITVVGTALFGCDALSTEPSGGSANGGSADRSVTEAPMLTSLVEAGELPELAERLPKEPLVVQPHKELGTYGGTWRTALVGTVPFWLIRSLGYENLMRWDPEFKTVLPNIAKEATANDDATTYTFVLREGMRWSDGEPFTVDDVLFWYDSVLMNTELTPAGPPRWLRPGGQSVVVEKVDNLTFTMSFAAPNGLLLQRLATPESPPITWLARHYFEQFHPDFNPDANARAKEEGFADWVELFNAMGGSTMTFWSRADVPTLLPWRVQIPIGETNRVVVQRNPYYFKTDPEGRQLPYVDEVVNDVVQDQEVLVVKVLNGEIDMRSRDVAILRNKPTLAAGRDKGDYHFFDHVPTYMNKALVAFNLNHPDPIKREIFLNKDFRIGLSHAIDRQKLIDTVYQRQGEPWQVAPREDSPFYHEPLATQYLEFDLDVANDHLDRAGFTARDGDGRRLGPDGKPISFHLEAVNELRPEMTDVAEFLRTSWAEVGIDARVRAQSRDLYVTREQANEFDVVVWIGDAGGRDAILDPRWYFPYGPQSAFARLWGLWYSSDGADGEEPPEPARRQMELYNELSRTLDEDERAELMAEILTISAEEFYLIGTVKDPVGYGVVKNNFRNVPDAMPDSWMYPDPGPTNPEQYFFTS